MNEINARSGLRVMSDGTTIGTKVYTESGEAIGGIIRLELVIDAQDGSAIAQMKLNVFPGMLDIFVEKTNIQLHAYDEDPEVVRDLNSEGAPLHVKKDGDEDAEDS
jgi:hypothetical protein